MASIRKRSGRYEVRVRMGGVNRFATFDTKSEAADWGRREEARILLQPGEVPVPRDSFGQWVQKYIEEVADRHVTAKDKKARLRKVLKMPISARPAALLKPGDFETLKGRLLASGLAPQTVRHYLQDCSAVWESARKEWRETSLPNPLHDIDMPPVSKGRKKRVPPDLWGKILASLRQHVNPFYAPFAEFLLETAMRVHEPLLVKAGDIDAPHSVLTVVGKGGEQRSVPLSPRALEILTEVVELRKRVPKSFAAPGGGYYDLTGYAEDAVWPISYRGFARAWSDARKAAGDSTVWIHDIRRERATRLIEDGWDLASVAGVTGHRSLNTLRDHYTVVEAQRLASRLAQTQVREGRPRRRGGGAAGKDNDSK